MKVTVVSSSEWAYPDIWEYQTASNAIRLNTPKNAMPSVQILLSGVEKGAAIRVKLTGALALEQYEMVPVFVESTVKAEIIADLSDPGHPRPLKGCPSRFAPFYVYDCIKPLGDALTPMNGVAGLYFCFPIAAEQKEGVVEGGLEITVDGESLTIPVSVKVYPVAIPDEEHLKVYNFYSPWHIAAYHHVQEDTPEFDALHEKYLKLFRRMKQNMIRVSPPEVTEDAPGKYSFDFSQMTADVEKLSNLGYKYFALGLGHRRSWKEPTIIIRGMPAMSYEAYVYLSQYLPALNEQILKNGWKGQIITSVSDEPNNANATEYRALCGLVRKLAPDLVLHDALSYTAVHGALDIWVPKNSEYDKHTKEFESFRGKGDELWHYTCCNPRLEGYVNRFTDYPLLSTRLLYWGNYKYNLAGFLHWGGNMYQPGQDPFTCSCPWHTNTDSNGQLPAGDTHIVYPGKDEPWASMRLEAHRLSAEDYELLRMLAQKDRAAADRICDACFHTFKDVEYDPDLFERTRIEMLRLLS